MAPDKADGCPAVSYTHLLPGVFLQQILTTLIYAMVNADYSIRLEWKIGTLLMTAGIYCGSYLLALFRLSLIHISSS